MAANHPPAYWQAVARSLEAESDKAKIYVTHSLSLGIAREAIFRRIVERGVRVVQLYFGSSENWEEHDDIRRHAGRASMVDQPIAALLRDLESRGLLDETQTETRRSRPAGRASQLPTATRDDYFGSPLASCVADARAVRTILETPEYNITCETLENGRATTRSPRRG